MSAESLIVGVGSFGERQYVLSSTVMSRSHKNENERENHVGQMDDGSCNPNCTLTYKGGNYVKTTSVEPSMKTSLKTYAHNSFREKFKIFCLF